MQQPVLSLRSGGVIGIAINPVINPNNLKIEGWYAKNNLERTQSILPSREVRDFIPKGIVVDDYTALTPMEDIIRMKDIVELEFELITISVITESNKKLGKVVDYAVDDDGFFIKKLYVNPPILRGLMKNQLIIDRDVIVEITTSKIVVKDAYVTNYQNVRLPATA